MSEDTVEISEESAARAAGEEVEAAEDAATPAGAADDEQVTALEGELEKTKERLLRQMAEFQNYRRRTEQEKNTLVQAGKAKVLVQVLDVYDDIARSIDAADQLEEQDESDSPAYAKLRQGVQMVYQKFSDELTRLGVEPIEAIGQPFDEHVHEAMLQQPAPEGTEAGIVLDEIQKGYRMGDRVLRHSRVIVSA